MCSHGRRGASTFDLPNTDVRFVFASRSSELCLRYHCGLACVESYLQPLYFTAALLRPIGAIWNWLMFRLRTTVSFRTFSANDLRVCTVLCTNGRTDLQYSFFILFRPPAPQLGSIEPLSSKVKLQSTPHSLTASFSLTNLCPRVLSAWPDCAAQR